MNQITAKRLVAGAGFILAVLALLGTVSFQPAIAIAIMLACVAAML